MKKLVIFLILIAAAGGGAFYYYKYGKTVEKPQVIQATISRGDIVEVVNATGTLEPMRRVDVGSQVSGVVQELFVDYNSIVKRGQVLAKIDPQPAPGAGRDSASQHRAAADGHREPEGPARGSADAARSDAGAVRQATAEPAAARSRRLAVKNRQAQIASAQKQMVQSEAQLSQAKLNVSYTTIVSPIDGVVVERRVDRGQTVQASMNAPTLLRARDRSPDAEARRLASTRPKSAGSRSDRK